MRRLSPNTVHFEAPLDVGQVVNLLADSQSAMRRYPTAAQDSILPHMEMPEAKVSGANTLVCRIDSQVDALLVRNAD